MLSERQGTILNIVKENSPITGQHIADQLHVTRAALRSDLAIFDDAGTDRRAAEAGIFLYRR